MPYLCSNIPRNIFYSALVGEFLRIARCTLKLEDFLAKAKHLIQRMNLQGATSYTSKRHLQKIINRHPENFKQFGVNVEQLIGMLL